jgi:hypothetical protein
MKKRISLIHFVVVGELRDRYGLRSHLDLSDGLANRFQTLVEAEESSLQSPMWARLTRRIVPALVRSLYLARSLWKLPTPIAA